MSTRARGQVRRCGILPLALVTTTACQPAPQLRLDDIALPAEAVDRPFEGQFENVLDAAMLEITRELGTPAGKPEELIRLLAASSNTDSVLAWFGPQLTAARFARDSAVPVAHRHFRLHRWQSASQALAVAVIEAGADSAGQPIRFLFVALAPRR